MNTRKLSRREKPVLTRDGLTAVQYCVNDYPLLPGYEVGALVRPEEKIEQILQLINELELTFSSSIMQWGPLQVWEFVYLSEGRRLHIKELPAFWTEAQAHRASRLGAWRITGNFVTLSKTFHVETRDPVLLQRFRDAFAAQPEGYYEAAAEWEKRCEQSFAPKRRRWEGVSFEQYYRELCARNNVPCDLGELE